MCKLLKISHLWLYSRTYMYLKCQHAKFHKHVRIENAYNWKFPLLPVVWNILVAKFNLYLSTDICILLDPHARKAVRSYAALFERIRNETSKNDMADGKPNEVNTNMVRFIIMSCAQVHLSSTYN